MLTVAGAALWAAYGPYFAFITEALPRNVAGGALGLINSFGALGSFAGTYFVGALAAAGRQGFAYLLLACALVVAGGITLLVPVPMHEATDTAPAAT